MVFSLFKNREKKKAEKEMDELKRKCEEIEQRLNEKLNHWDDF